MRAQPFLQVLSKAVVLLTLSLSAAAADSPLGQSIHDFTLPDPKGQEHRLSDWQERKVVVLVFLSDDCPVAQAYVPRLGELAREFEPRGVTFVAIFPGARGNEKLTFSFPTLEDVTSKTTARIGAQRTPEAMVLNDHRVVRYRGRIDDQFEPMLRRARVGRHDLVEAIKDVLGGKPVRVPETQVPGCPIDLPVPAPKVAATLTYSRDIAPILQNRCVLCHRRGEAAPFPLTTYREVRPRIRRIQEAVEERRMPPWLADPTYGHFANDNRLTDAEERRLLTWIEGGAAEGDTHDLPPPPSFPEGWRIPEPDLVVSMPQVFQIPAAGAVEYQYFEVDPGFKEDKWVQMAELRPSNRAVVHHGLVFLRPPGVSDGLIAQGELKSVWLTGFGQGSPPLVLPPGRAKRIPAGWKLVFQLHYVAKGTAQKDQTSIGFKFADPKSVKQEVATNMAYPADDQGQYKLHIPPRASDVKVEVDHTFTDDVELLSLNPHMHKRGRSFQFEAIYPDGTREILLNIPRYNFEWQDTYVLKEPKRLPKGTVMHCTAHFDNSAANLVNPDPDKEVTWGDQVDDEMMVGYFDIVRADQDLTSWREFFGRTLGQASWTIYAAVGLLLVNMILLVRKRRRRRGLASAVPGAQPV